MKHFRYDIHIHSALSPCADRLNSPNNVLNMAHLTKLDIIAITDHNSLKQTFITNELSKSYHFLHIFGVEITSVEGFHILCYVKNQEQAKKLDNRLEQEFISPNKSHQSCMVFDEYDNELYEFPYDLHQNSSLDIKAVRDMIDQLEGIMILAHIERYSDELIKVIENNIALFHAIEVNLKTDIISILNSYPWIKQCNIVRNSDAHTLLEIGSNPDNIKLNSLSVDDFFEFFR